jgi:hypothetical protein
MLGERISDDQSCIPKRTLFPSRDRIAERREPLKRHRRRKGTRQEPEAEPVFVSKYGMYFLIAGGLYVLSSAPANIVVI